MKKITTTLFLILILPAALFGQKRSDWRKTDDHWVRKNSISVTGSTVGMSGYNTAGFGHINIEYDRMIAYNLSVSAMGLYAPGGGGFASDTYTQEEIFYFAGIKVNYNLPVVRNWLYFRIGIGGGVGFHDIRGRSMGECWYGGCGGPGPADEYPPGAESDLTNRVKVHFIADMYWVFRATEWLELRFAPLLASPSQIIFGSRFNAPYNSQTFYYFNWGGTLGVGVRF